MKLEGAAEEEDAIHACSLNSNWLNRSQGPFYRRVREVSLLPEEWGVDLLRADQVLKLREARKGSIAKDFWRHIDSLEQIATISAIAMKSDGTPWRRVPHVNRGRTIDVQEAIHNASIARLAVVPTSASKQAGS